MPSALAAQLAKSVSLNAPLLSETARKKHFASSSYLFSSGSKGQIDDLDSIHALATNALAQLKLVFPSIAYFDEQSQVYQSLFSYKARGTDRTLLPRDEAKEVDDALKACLRGIGPCLLESAAGRVLEWLVRRFRVNEFNVPDVLALFLPYHESPHFAKMVSILTVDARAPWAFLEAYKAAGKPVSRSALVTEMLKVGDLARFVVSLLPEALHASGGLNVHRTLLSFNTAVVLEYVTRAGKKGLDAGTLAFLLPLLLEPLNVNEGDGRKVSSALQKDGILGSYVLLSALSQKCAFSPAALKGIVSSMVHCASATSLITAAQLITALVSLLSPQETLDDFPGSVADQVIDFPDVQKAVRALLGWSGLDKVVTPMLDKLVAGRSEEKNATFIRFLLETERVPDTIVKQLTKQLVCSTLIPETSEGTFLPELHQRHPGVLRNCIGELVGEDGSRSIVLEQLLLTVTVPEGSQKAPRDLIIASTDAEPAVRASAVKQIARLLSGDYDALSASAAELTSFQDALFARIYDSSPAVLDTLYANPAALLSHIATPAVLSSLAKSLIAQAVPRSVLRSHLAFLCNALYVAHPACGTQLVLEIVLPHALFSKPRHKTATSVWELVGVSKLADHKLLRGTRDVVQGVTAGAKEGEKVSPEVDEMAKVNDALARKLAENFQASNDYPELLEWLLGRTKRDIDAHERLLSLLITRALLVNLSGEHQVDAAFKVLQTIDVGEINDLGRLVDDTGAFDTPTFEEALSKGVILKPSSQSSAQRLQLGIIAFVPSIRCPTNSQINWFSHGFDSPKSARDARFLHLMRTVYTVVNESASGLALVAHINKALFENLGADTLLFLAGVWTHPHVGEGAVSDDAKYIALRHASAFLRAQPADKAIDFQTILPSFLCAMQSVNKRVRTAASECIHILSTIANSSKAIAIFAFDQVYGSASALLQYLDWTDEKKYLQVLSDHRNHLISDAGYLVTLHHESLSQAKTEGKKEAKLRLRILCFLLSHIVCCPSLAVRQFLLESLRQVSGSVKLQMLLPFIEQHLDAAASSQAGVQASDLLTLALECFDSSAAKEINVGDSGAWSALLRLLQHYHKIGNPTPPWTCLVTSLSDGLFASLSSKRQLEICLLLIQLGSEHDEGFGIKQLLARCVKPPALANALLKSLKPISKEANERASKRAKTDISSMETEQKDSLAQLTFLAEVLSSQDLPGSLELVSSLLDTLSRTVSAASYSQGDVIYVEQLLMTCVDSAASQIKELPNLAPSAIRLDVLVELMRTSENPQAFHQALLLMASLARLSSESVIHNVMPIFTFMGSNVFHRDDSYSFKVIQRTTESIVPVVTASLKEKHDNSLELSIGARDFLRTFTDASTHIPRHRRTSFFTHLVDVLGPSDFLAPIVMLLADKVANRIPRQVVQEALAALVLPLSIMQHYSPSVQIAGIKEIIYEAQRIFSFVKEPTSAEKTFLETTSSDDQTASVVLLKKRQCQTLLIFIGHAMKQMASLRQEPDSDMRGVISALLELAIVDHDGQSSLDITDIGTSARWALLQALSMISAAYFAASIQSMLSSGNKKIQQGALELLSDRVPEMNPEAREATSGVIAQIIAQIREIVSSAREPLLIVGSMTALRGVASTAFSKEEVALTSMVPIVLETIKAQPAISECMSVIPIFIAKLGPRIIPYLRQLIDTCVSTLDGNGKTLDHKFAKEGLQSLSCLVKTVPTFWGVQEVRAVVDLYLKSETGSSSSMSTQLDKVVKLLAKQIPSKIMMSALSQSWPSIEDINRVNGAVKFARFFGLLKRCLHFATRSDVLENIRGLFNHFLQSFGVRSIIPVEEASKLEDNIFVAYLELVIKLNETAFQPLFRKSCDWAFGEGSSTNRKITFCRLYSALLELFRELMTPYVSLLLNDFVELLGSFRRKEPVDRELWLASIETLSKSLSVDEGAYWRDEKLRLVADPLVQQIPVCIEARISPGKSVLTSCLVSLVDCMDDDASLRSVNLGVLMHSRSEDIGVRLFAISCSVAIWQAHGTKLSGFGPQTATFIIECAEDENDDVVRECHKLKVAVEAEVGKIDGL